MISSTFVFCCSTEAKAFVWLDEEKLRKETPQMQ